MESYPLISLKAARVNAGLTQQQAAQQLNICKDTLQHYECGKSVPNWETVKRIEHIYNFTADQIFFGRNSA